MNLSEKLDLLFVERGGDPNEIHWGNLIGNTLAGLTWTGPGEKPTQRQIDGVEIPPPQEPTRKERIERTLGLTLEELREELGVVDARA